tara:strand:- start:3346 stop:3570 length:225 start_codon:yes stop_codon:yes gene_type:complete
MLLGKSAHWWFGKNSIWQKSGLKDQASSKTLGFFDGLTDFLTGRKKPEVQVDHGVTDTVKYGAIALIAYMVLMK